MERQRHTDLMVCLRCFTIPPFHLSSELLIETDVVEALSGGSKRVARDHANLQVSQSSVETLGASAAPRAK